MLLFACYDKSMPMILYNCWCYKHFNKFPVVLSWFCDILASFTYAVCFSQGDQEIVYCQLIR